MKTIVELKNDMMEVFEPMTKEEVEMLCGDDFGKLLTIEANTTYLENERVIVVADGTFYNLNRNDFNKFRINTLEGRCFTYTDYKMHNNLDDAFEFLGSAGENVVVITRNLFQDEDGDFTELVYYTTTLEG